MAFNPLGIQPKLRDGMRGEGLVTKSAAGPDRSGSGEDTGYTGGFKHFSATTPMIVRVPGNAPFHVTPQRLASREKYAVAGMRLPLTVSHDLRKVRIEWDEVPTIDEMIERGDRIFTEPDAVSAELRAAVAEVAHTGGIQPRGLARAPVEGPSARVIAVGHGANDQNSVFGKRELLLSVSTPGRARYGVRWRQRPPRGKVVIPGMDLAVRADPSDPQKLEISWDGVGSVLDLAARIVASASPVPQQPPAPAAPDPLDQLKRLGELRARGVLTEDEFAAAKARLLAQT